MKLPLGNGKFALVDEEDYDRVARYPWSAHYGNKRNPYPGATVLLHRLILGFPDGIIDHINRNTYDCRKENLRVVSVHQNGWNKSYHKRDGLTSQYWGVFYDSRPGVWRARIRHEGENYYLGRFQCEREAARAYNDKCLELRGPDFAVLNDIED